MANERWFVDCSYLMARFNPRDRHHDVAKRLHRRIPDCREIWTTEAVLIEVAAAFSRPLHRPIAVMIWDGFQESAHCRVAPVSNGLLVRAVELFRQYTDKSWSLADCASFVLMRDEGLTEALTADRHFIQAGFRALLLE